MPSNSTGLKSRPKKRFGQNFLIDKGVIDSIIEVADIQKTDTVLEIGPGRGALTGKLAELAGQLIAVEIDWDLAKLLEEEYGDRDNTKIIQGDILKQDLSEIFLGDTRVKVVANLPYYITTPIIMKLLEGDVSFERIIVMVQKEVALRMCAMAGSADYGALSLAVRYYTEPSVVCEVPAASFRPVPKVDSSVVMLQSKPQDLNKNDREYLFKCIKAAFSQRRKTLVNAINSAGLGAKDEVKMALKEAGFGENIRGESLNLEDFIIFSRKLGDIHGSKSI